MKRFLVTLFFGFVWCAALVSNAPAQMCGCMSAKGEGMQKGGMMGGMGCQEQGMMRGMGGMKGGGMMMDEDHPLMKHLMSLRLDDKQKDTLKALRSKTMKDLTKKRADKQIAGIELKDLLDKDPVDIKSVEAVVKKKEALEAEMFLAHLKAHEEMKSILTPEQRKQLKEMMEGGGSGCSMMGGDAEQKDMPMSGHKH